uniref:Titin n=1 Tax=Gadus morhua TaxID=8049 RepID=A0A8C5CYA7_GADMO
MSIVFSLSCSPKKPWCALITEAKTPPSFPKKITSLQQTEGKVVRFECRVAGSSPVEVSWLRDGEPLEGDEVSMSYDDNTAVLEIRPGEMRHSGEYSCVATNSVGKPRYAPIFETKLSPQEVTVGESVELECHMTGSAPIKVTWSKDHKDIRSGGNYRMTCVENISHLTILKADKGDTGKYFYITVKERKNPPTFTKKPSESIEDTEGKLVKIEGRVAGSQPMAVSWYKGDMEIHSSDKYDISFKSNAAVLCIKNSQVSDSGKYSCQASNEAGKASCGVSLDVAGPIKNLFTFPRFKYLFSFLAPIVEVDVKLIEGITVKAGTTIRLPAIMRGIPVPTAKWCIEGEEITTEGNVKIDTDNFSTVLSINDCTRNHTGSYLLTVSNPAGSKTVGLSVTVLDVPAAPIGPLNILEVTPDSMEIEWRPPKDDGGSPVINYIVEKRESNKESWGGVSSGSTANILKISRLQKGVEYVVRIRAENKMGIGAALESMPTVAQHSFEAPSHPGKPHTSDIAEDAVTVGWTMPLADGGSQITGYLIERRHIGGKWIRVNKTPCKDLRYRVLGLFEGNNYEFRVFAENIAGYSGPSPISDPCKPCRPITVPSHPINPKVKDYSKSTADLVWSKPNKDGGSPILGYTVEMKKADSEEWKKVNLDDFIKQCAYRVKALEEGQEYRFRVFASNMIGDGESREIAESTIKNGLVYILCLCGNSLLQRYPPGGGQ